MQMGQAACDFLKTTSFGRVNTMVSAMTEGHSPTELEPTSVEVKRYQHEKLVVSICSLVVSLVGLLILALWAGPRLDPLVRHRFGDGQWWRLIVLAGIYAGVVEI